MEKLQQRAKEGKERTPTPTGPCQVMGRSAPRASLQGGSWLDKPGMPGIGWAICLLAGERKEQSHSFGIQQWLYQAQLSRFRDLKVLPYSTIGPGELNNHEDNAEDVGDMPECPQIPCLMPLFRWQTNSNEEQGPLGSLHYQTLIC